MQGRRTGFGAGGEPTSKKHPWGFHPRATTMSALSSGLAQRGQVATKVVQFTLQMDICAPSCALCVLPARPASFRNFAQHGEQSRGDFQTA